MTAMTIVSFDKVGKNFRDRTVFENISFELKRGGRYGLLGPNGAGKSTLIRLMAGSLRPDHGRVLVEGQEPWRHPARARAFMGLLPERAPLIGELTVDEHLALAGQLKGLGNAAFKEQRGSLIQALGLGRLLKRPAASLSQGQKRRAALASALLGPPPLLILDEPSSGLDPEESYRLIDLLMKLPGDLTMLISSHILTEVHLLTESVMVIAQGGLAFFGPWLNKGSQGEPTEEELRRKYLGLIGVGEV